MRIFVEQNDGSLEPFGELTEIPDVTELLIFQVNRYISKEDADLLENNLSSKSGKKCIVLGPEFMCVLGTS